MDLDGVREHSQDFGTRVGVVIDNLAIALLNKSNCICILGFFVLLVLFAFDGLRMDCDRTASLEIVHRSFESA